MSDDHTRKIKDKRRLMLTQLLRAPVLNPAGTEVGRLEDIVVKLADGAYPPLGGLKVRVGAQDHQQDSRNADCLAFQPVEFAGLRLP